MKNSTASTPDSVSDWLLGGFKRRALLVALMGGERAEWTVPELRVAANCGLATAYETVKALRAIRLLESAERENSYAIAERHPLAKPLREWIEALEPFSETPVERPRRGRRRS